VPPVLDPFIREAESVFPRWTERRMTDLPVSPLGRPLGLDAAIDAVTASYDGPLEINNLESAALPNKRAVVEAFNHLVPVV
jgi:hypothetical protein